MHNADDIYKLVSLQEKDDWERNNRHKVQIREERERLGGKEMNRWSKMRFCGQTAGKGGIRFLSPFFCIRDANMCFRSHLRLGDGACGSIEDRHDDWKSVCLFLICLIAVFLSDAVAPGHAQMQRTSRVRHICTLDQDAFD